MQFDRAGMRIRPETLVSNSLPAHKSSEFTTFDKREAEIVLEKGTLNGRLQKRLD